MENASKALLMAAGVLLGILILSLAVYLFVSFGNTSAELHKENEANQLSQFNSKFTSYEEKTGITIYDVITIANLATDSNQYYEFSKRNSIENQGKDTYIYVSLKNDTYVTGKMIEGETTQVYNTIIQNDVKKLENASQEKLDEYTCKTLISQTTRKSL